MSECLFCRIAAGDIPSDTVYATDDVIAFHDIDPKAPTHVLVIPRRHFDNAAEMTADDPDLAARWLAAATEVARSLGVADTGYRLVINTGVDGGQSVDHVHVHLLAKRGMGWPPG